MVQPQSGLNQAISNAGNTNLTIALDYSVCLTADLVIPHNVQLIIRRNGRIHLCGHQLTIQGTFEAGYFQVFEYSQPKHSFKETERVIFKARSVERVVSTWFGTHPNNEDNASALQRAIDSAYAVCHVFIPSGIYKLKDTIHLARHTRVEDGNFTGFQQFILEGASRTENQTHLDGTDEKEFNIGTTKLEYVNSEQNRPLINIQFGIGTILRDLLLEGGLSKSHNEGSGRKRPNRDYWIECPNLVGRHNPYCAIATDAYIGRPDPLTPEQAYPTNLEKGVEYLDSNSGSQDILLERVSIFRFGVGIAIAPGGNAQNDAIFINQCRFDGCTYGVAVGSTQARQCHVSNSAFYRAFAAITTSDFGSGSSSLLNLTSNQYKDCRMLYRLISSYAGPCNISGDYCENVVRLGNFGLISSVSGFITTISFQGCNYNFENVNVKGFGTLGLILNNSIILKFQGCSFQSKSSFVEKTDDAQLPTDVPEDPKTGSEGLPPISELHLLSMGPGFAKFIFDGCSFRFPSVEESDNIPGNASLQEPPIRIIPYATPYHFNQAKNDIFFSDCLVWVQDGQNHIQLSDELPVYLNNVYPRRVPIHWSTRSIRISGGIAGEQTVAIRNTLKGDRMLKKEDTIPGIVSLPILLVDSIKVIADKNQTDYNGKLQIKWKEKEKKKDEKNINDDKEKNGAGNKEQATSLIENDRLFWFCRFDLGEGNYAGTRPYVTAQASPLPIPMFIVTKVDKTDTVETDTAIEYGFVAEAEVPIDASGSRPRIPYRDEVFPLKVTETATSEADSFEKLEYLRRVFIMPRSDFRQPENSQYYVILNGSVQGKFEHGEATVTEVTNIQLLQPGDFVNQDYVPSGTRIKAIDLTNKSVELTQPVEIPGAVGNNSVVDHIPFCYVSSI